MSTEGDGAFAVFTSPRECLLAAWQAQHTLAEHPWPGGEDLRVRMGAHTGEADVQNLYPRGETLDVGGAIRVALGEAEPD